MIGVSGPTVIEATALTEHPLGVTHAEVAAAGESPAAVSLTDVAIVVVGVTEEQETETVDKPTIRLSGAQDAMVSTVAAAVRQPIVVANAAMPENLSHIAAKD